MKSKVEERRMEYTFGVITYNHEKFILELLESIKYQKLVYGHDVKVNLVVSDDSSKDHTVYMVQEWIKINKSLFEECIVLESPSNQGVVSNFKKIMKYIKSEHFKVIAGDDVFADRNVFHCMKNADEHSLVTYMPIVLQDEQLSLRKDWMVKHLQYTNKKRSHRYDVIKQEMGSYFHTPCTFYKRVQYTRYYEKHSTFLRLFEDDPLWHAILSGDEKANVVFREEYLVLYRQHGNAICSAKDSPYAKEFAKELKKYKMYLMKKEKNVFAKIGLAMQIYQPKCKYLYIMNYINAFKMRYRNMVCVKQKKYKEAYDLINLRLQETQKYYDNILEEVKKVKKEMNFE